VCGESLVETGTGWEEWSLQGEVGTRDERTQGRDACERGVWRGVATLVGAMLLMGANVLVRDAS
jgi:hypothetical protein